jgi:hypothetical protein
MLAYDFLFLDILRFGVVLWRWVIFIACVDRDLELEAEASECSSVLLMHRHVA